MVWLQRRCTLTTIKYRSKTKDTTREDRLFQGNGSSIDIWSIAHVFKAGHSFCHDITSSNYPRCNRTPNTKQKISLDDEFEFVQQTIYHDRYHPSALILPGVTKDLDSRVSPKEVLK
ncbi:MAG: hypothetical protein E3J30_11785 [Anaerolineales bacterium]|nr:MAG: hypothetical protein E3J30_11785 [Anaerolineales bacterium]